MMRRQLTISALLLALLLNAYAGEPVSTGFWGNTAIGGRDTTAYYIPEMRKSHSSIEGDKRFEVQYLGAAWRFASQESAQRFAASPQQYVPRYNGHCANALALGEGLIATDGTVWEFFGDRLHLFYGEAGRQRWLKGDWKAFQATADSAWKAIVKQ